MTQGDCYREALESIAANSSDINAREEAAEALAEGQHLPLATLSATDQEGDAPVSVCQVCAKPVFASEAIMHSFHAAAAPAEADKRLVCFACGKPVTGQSNGVWGHVSSSDALECRVGVVVPAAPASAEREAAPPSEDMAHIHQAVVKLSAAMGHPALTFDIAKPMAVTVIEFAATRLEAAQRAEKGGTK